MKVLYLLGGAGNVYFQLLKMKKDDHDFLFTDVLISAFVRRLLGHTNHVSVYEDLYSMTRKDNFIGLLILPLVIIDYLLCRYIRLSLFTTFDLRSVKNKRPFLKVAWVGYFQDSVHISDIKKYEILRPSILTESIQNVIHIRGGDFIKYEGALGVGYYRKAIEQVGFVGEEVVVITDDVKFSEDLLKKLPLDKYNVSIVSGDSITDLQRLATAKRIVSSNSTFALVASISSPDLQRAIYPRSLIHKFVVDENMLQYIDAV